MAGAFATRIESLDDGISATFEGASVPGAGVAIFHRGAQWSKGYGVANVEQPHAVTAHTIFQIASATKCFTTLALFRLLDDGKLSLDAPITTYLPAFSLRDPEHARAITVRHLLQHRSGLEGDFCVDTGSGAGALATAVDRLNQAEIVHAPGAMYSYCNAGFYLAGRIIEVLTGLAYESAIAELVLGPLKLAHSFFFANDVITRQFAVGHGVAADGIKVVHRWSPPRAANPIVGLASSLDDLLQFAVFHLGTGVTPDGSRILSSEALQTLLSPSTDEVTGLSLAHTWAADCSSGSPVLTAGGNMPQQVCRLVLVPREHFGMAILANSTAGGAFADHVQRRALREFCGFEPESVVRELANADLRSAACGTFVNPTSDILIEERDGNLFAQVTMKRGGFPYETLQQRMEWPRLPLALYASGRFAILPETTLERWGRVVRSRGGSIDHVLAHGRAHIRVSAGRHIPLS